MCVFVCVCVCACVRACVHYVYVCMRTLCICVHACVRACVSACAHVCKFRLAGISFTRNAMLSTAATILSVKILFSQSLLI